MSTPNKIPHGSTVQAFLDLIDDMRSDGHWEFADRTLTDIYDTVDGKGWVTDGQKRAIRNIGASRARAWEEDFDEGRGCV